MKRTASLGSDFNAEFADIIAAEWPDLVGRQCPQTLVCAEGGDLTHGEKALELARRFGIKAMPWQRRLVLLALQVDSDGRWVHPDVVVVCPRQNGKSLVLEIIVLYRLFVLGHQIVFTAHQWKTAKSIRNRLWKRIKAKPWAARRLVRNTASAGEAEMETAEGGKIQFTTRSNDAGRGFDEIDLLLLDEAYNLQAGELDAMAPTQLASVDPQTFYTSSSVNSAVQANGEELSKVRARALSGDDEGLMLAEFCAPEGLSPDDPETWALANPSMGVIATEKKIRSMRTKLTEVGFEVEMLGWGRWFSSESSSSSLIDVAAWSLRAGSPEVPGDSCVGVDANPKGDAVGVVAAQCDGQGFFLSAAPITEFDRSEIVGTVARSVDLNDSLAVVLDPSGACSTLVEPMGKAGIEAELVTGGQVSRAYELLKRLWSEGRIVHDGDPRWVEAWRVAEERSTRGKFRSFDRFSGDVQLLVAASFALWGLHEFAIPEAPALDVKRKFVAVPQSARGDALAAMAF